MLYQLRNVSKRFTKAKETLTIFDNLNMDIPEGDFVAMMGPSGSGKTTLLNILGGIDKVTGGEVNFDGKRIDGYSEGQLSAWRAANVGFIFQFYNLMPMLSAAQNVELPLMLTSLSGATRKANVATAAALRSARSSANPTMTATPHNAKPAISSTLAPVSFQTATMPPMAKSSDGAMSHAIFFEFADCR